LKLIEDSTINGKIAKDVLDKMFDSGLDDSIPNLTAKQIIERDGLSQVTDVSAIEKIIDNILESNKPNVEKYKAGSGNLLGFFVGQVMKQSGGKANPKIVNEILLEKLK
jgi:Asp-tRNA(Asn)/Glu-tRNA(Gln) amidotransferase B subunit